MSTLGEDDTALEAQLGLMILRPDGAGLEKVRKLIDIAEPLSAWIPGFLSTLKGLATVGCWPWNPRKADRVHDAIIGLYERLQRTRTEYVRREEFGDLVEETLRRMSEQPDAKRRQDLRMILFKVIETPREHSENRLFLRLADEFPVGALKVLAAVEPVIVQAEYRQSFQAILAARTGLDITEVGQHMADLSAAGLFDQKAFRIVAMPGKSLVFLLTRRGAMFLQYCRSRD
jgi:hypothetical protein